MPPQRDPKPQHELPVQSLKYLSGYAPELLAQVLPLLEQGRVLESLEQRHGPVHAVRTDAALYDYVMALKQRFMRSAAPLTKVVYDPKLQIVQQALGTHTRISRVQGSQLKAKREIRVASLFRQAPAPFLKMIVVHELAHLKQAAHDKAFYALCGHMEPAYHQLEFDLRLWLCGLEFEAARLARSEPPLRASAACA
ncbi:MAG: YgjP-like metallopeptidase domain-containing protein [Rubrivivax sp.]